MPDHAPLAVAGTVSSVVIEGVGDDESSLDAIVEMQEESSEGEDSAPN